MRPSAPIPQDLRDRLDAARETLDVDIQWVEQGDPRCFGRQFGFWIVTAAPYGWREQLAAHTTTAPVCGVGPPPIPCPAWVQIEGAELERSLLYVLDAAERRWPLVN